MKYSVYQSEAIPLILGGGDVLMAAETGSGRYIYLTKTSIRYAKENDREKRERKKGRRRDIEREGEIREREVKGIERVKARRVKSS